MCRRREAVRLDVVRPTIIEQMRERMPRSAEPRASSAANDLDRYPLRLRVGDADARARRTHPARRRTWCRVSPTTKSLAENIEAEFAVKRTFGERMSDRLASFGGSWTFIGAVLRDPACSGWPSTSRWSRKPSSIRIPSSCSIWCCRARAAHPGADHHDEPEAAGGEGSPAVGERLSGRTSRPSSRSATCTRRSITC